MGAQAEFWHRSDALPNVGAALQVAMVLERSSPCRKRLTRATAAALYNCVEARGSDLTSVKVVETLST